MLKKLKLLSTPGKTRLATDFHKPYVGKYETIMVSGLGILHTKIDERPLFLGHRG